MEHELLNQLYQAYQRELLLYLYSLCGNRPLAEDLMQETFLKALLSLPESHPNLKAWLYLVARNLFFNHQKRERNLHPEGISENLPDAHAVPLEQILADERTQALCAALNTLEPRRREVMQLQYFSGLSLREIAAVLHISPEYVRVLAHRARKELKQRMEENGYDLS